MLQVTKSSNSSLLDQIQKKQDTLFEKLASGKRINKAADGAAAQQIIDRLTSQIEGNRQSISNAYDGVSLSQVAEGGLSGISNDVSRIRELTVQAGNGILSAGDKKAIQSEITQLQDNIKRTTEQTEFGGKPLLSSDGNIEFQVGANAGQKIDVGTKDIAAGLSDILSVDVTAAGGVDSALQAADKAVEFVGESRADLGAIQNRFESAARNLANADVNVSAARSRIQDTDFAQTTSEQAANNILSQSTVSVQAQANQQKSQVLSLLS